LACPGKGIAEDSCSLLNSLGVDWAGPLAVSPLVGGCTGIAASEGGIASLGAATELEVELGDSTAGVGGASAFSQPASAAATHAQARMERVMDIPNIAIS
tara:strand:- start:321370 stop:321669 length:300 start_codon:yes stop_codon:yes gene_type:complete